MKNSIFTVLLLTSFITTATHAYVEDTDNFTDIEHVEKVTLIKTLNIKPNTTETRIGDLCYLTHDSVNHDRTITAPKSIEFVRSFKDYYMQYSWMRKDVGFHFEGLESSNTIYCYFSSGYADTSFGIMKSRLKDYVEIVPALPVEMK